MSELELILLFTTLAGAALPAGGALAHIERLGPRWLEQEFRHGVLAFGGGVLLSAVALVLVPEGTKHLGTWSAAGAFIAGGLVFSSADRMLTRSGTAVANLMAALLDFAPEAIALGALIASEPELGAVLALFIALQNLPEGFNAYREMTNGGRMRSGKALRILVAAVALGPVCGVLGYWILRDAGVATAATMLFASGGILYLIFQDIAPQARLRRHWAPPLGAVLGFALGLIGNAILGR